MAKLTYDQILQFRSAGQAYINGNPTRTKLHYAIEKTLKKTQTHYEDYSDKENDIRVDCALLNEKGEFVHMESQSQKMLATDPKKAKEQQKSIRALGRTEVEVELHFATETPKDLKAIWWQQFSGIVIKDDEEKELPSETSPLKLTPQTTE